MDDLKAYPPYRNAVEEIIKDVEAKGYSRLYTHDQLKTWMDIKDPKTIDEYKKRELEYLSALDNLKSDLLLEHRLYLENDHGKGYRVLEPDEQIADGADRHIKRAQKQILQATRVLTYVNEELLSLDGDKLRMRKLQRTAFLQAAFRKRRLPEVEKRKGLTL